MCCVGEPLSIATNEAIIHHDWWSGCATAVDWKCAMSWNDCFVTRVISWWRFTLVLLTLDSPCQFHHFIRVAPPFLQNMHSDTTSCHKHHFRREHTKCFIADDTKYTKHLFLHLVVFVSAAKHALLCRMEYNMEYISEIKRSANELLLGCILEVIQTNPLRGQCQDQVVIWVYLYSTRVSELWRMSHTTSTAPAPGWVWVPWSHLCPQTWGSAQKCG